MLIFQLYSVLAIAVIAKANLVNMIPRDTIEVGFLYEGGAKTSVTNRLPWFYPRYILKCFTALEWCVE